MGIRHLAAKAGEQEGGQDEDGDRQGDERSASFAEAKQDHQRQHLADEIVVEGRKELAPEERRKTPGQHQGSKHDPPPADLYE